MIVSGVRCDRAAEASGDSPVLLSFVRGPCTPGIYATPADRANRHNRFSEITPPDEFR
jgi:hypothetical protein